MSRRRQAIKRSVAPDGKYNNALVARLVNTVMISGKKSTAQRIVYGAFDSISEKNPASNPIEILQRAVDNAKPRIETKARRVGGATYQVPIEVQPTRSTTIAMRWLIDAARAKDPRMTLVQADATSWMAMYCLKLLRIAADAFARLKLPRYLKLALAGLLVGLIATEFPEVWGNGYVVNNRILHDAFLAEPAPLLFLLALLAAKLLATLLTVGSGAVGGVLTPTMFIGAALGATQGLTLHELGYATNLPTALFAAVGVAEGEF